MLTAALTTVARLNYVHNEQRLTDLDTELTASALGIAQVDLERRLGSALDLAAGTPDPGAVFRRAIASSVAPRGPFATAGLQQVVDGRVEFLTVLGSPSIKNLHASASLALFRRAARSNGLTTVWIVAGRQQRFGYLLSVTAAGRTLVAAAGQVLPASRRVSIPSASPDASLCFALYAGSRPSKATLVETNAPRLPLGSPSDTARVPLGTLTLTLVASPARALDGAWSAFVPWFILMVGIVFSLAVAVMADRLVLRRRHAEQLAGEVRTLYAEQRSISETLQRSLLPRELPQIAGVELAARYLPGTAGVEVGGDWYSAIRSGDDRFTFVVGDVSGRGVKAATVMARLRYTIRTLASLGFAPASILEMASHELDMMTDGHFATVLVGSVDVAGGELTLASAGHLQPVLVGPDGASFIEPPLGPPLGLGVTGYDECKVPFRRGESLVAFTDGLVERRGQFLDVQLDHVRDLVGRVEPGAKRLVEGLLAEFASLPPDDDVAVLAVHLVS